MPTTQQLHVDKILSTMSVQYRNEEMIWRNLLPVIPVVQRSDKFFVYTKADSYRLYDDKLSPKSMPNEIDWSLGTDNYSVKDHGFADWLPQEVIDNADAPALPEMDTNDFLNNMLEIAQENRVAGVVFNAANYPTANKTTLVGGAQWSDYVNSNPITDILTAIETCFIRANTLVLGIDVWLKLRAHPKILDAVKASTRFQASEGGLATTQELANLFDVDSVQIGRGRYITTKEGQTPTYARLWGKFAGALYVKPGPVGIRSITFGGTFVEQNRLTMRDFDTKRGVKGAHYLKVSWNSDEHVIASDLGYLISTAVA